MAKSKHLSLKIKTMAVCLSLTVALAGLSAYGLNVLKSQQETAAYATMAARSEALANAISARFYEHYVDIKLLAQHPALQGNDRAAIVHAFNGVARESNTFALMLFVDPKGHLIAVNEKTPEGESLDLPSLYARSFSDYGWFRSALTGHTSDSADRHMHGTYVEPMNDLPAMSAALGRKVRGNKFSTAVHNEAGEVIGVMAGAADHRWYHEPFAQTYRTMKDQKFPHTSLMLLDRAGRALEHELGDDRLDEASMITDFSRQTQAGEAGSFLLTARDGTEVMAGFQPLNNAQFADELGWSVVMQDSKSELLARVVEMQRAFYLALGIAMSVCVLGSYLFARRLGSNLTEVEEGLAASTRAIASAAAELSASSTELSGAAAEQATAIQETAASVDEVSAMAKKSAENAAQSQETSVVSRKAAEEGREAVQEMIRVIGAISESNAAITAQVEDGNRQISDIVKVIGEIGNKTKIINDIVFQTKLLSFNASVEAARAGEHGKGFAVVAEEVGNLARMSGDAAKEISAMLDSSIEKVESIVGQTQSKVAQLVVAGRAKVDSGSHVAATCGNTLGKILSLVQEVEGMVNEIASASNEQAQGVAEINRAMNSLDQVTQRNTSVARNAAEGSRGLTQQAQDLTGIIAQLHLLVQGSEAATAGAEDQAATTRPLGPPPRTRAAPTARHDGSASRGQPNEAEGSWRRGEQAVGTASRRGQIEVEPTAPAADYLPSRDDARFKNV